MEWSWDGAVRRVGGDEEKVDMCWYSRSSTQKVPLGFRKGSDLAP